MSFFSELRRRNVFRVAIAYTVTAWLLAQVSELALDSFEAPDWALKTLLFFLIVGWPIAVIFAWAYELTPEGIKREKDVDRTQSITMQTGRRIDFVIIGVLAAALILAVATHQWTDAIRGGEIVATDAVTSQSIAVLPFVNMSDDPDNEYFSDGISEELLNVLVRVEGLQVASRTSSFAFKGTNTSIPEIAESLGVDNVLEGSVRKAGNKVRITAQLIDVSTDKHLWSNTYDRELDDIFVVQDEISAAIVQALATTLGAGSYGLPASKTEETQNVAAYEIYLKGRYFWQRRGNENVSKAIELFEQAADMDPSFARAWSSLAAAHITATSYGVGSRDVHFPIAEKHALTALELDDSIAEAHAVLGDLARYRQRWIEAEQHYQAAIGFEPSNSTANLWYAEHLLSVGRIQPALEIGQKAYKLDPLSPASNSILSAIYNAAGDPEKSRKHAVTSYELGHPLGLFSQLELFWLARDLPGALEFIAEYEDELPDGIEQLIRRRFAALSDLDARQQHIDSLRNAGGRAGGLLMMDLVQYGKIAEAIEQSRNYEGAPPNAWFDFWRSDLGAMRSHPRFEEVIEFAGWEPYWDEYGWPQACSRTDDRISCR